MGSGTRLERTRVRFFREKISENHTSRIFLSKGELWYSLTRAAVPYLCSTSFYTATLVTIGHISAVDLLSTSALL